MGTYTTRDKVTGEVIAVAEAANVQAARAAAAATRFEVGLSTAQEILEWGKAGKDIIPPATRAKKPAFKDPNQTDLTDAIGSGAPEDEQGAAGTQPNATA